MFSASSALSWEMNCRALMPQPPISSSIEISAVFLSWARIAYQDLSLLTHRRGESTGESENRLLDHADFAGIGFFQSDFADFIRITVPQMIHVELGIGQLVGIGIVH